MIRCDCSLALRCQEEELPNPLSIVKISRDDATFIKLSYLVHIIRYLINVRSAWTWVESGNKSGKLTLQYKLVVPCTSLATLWCFFFHECRQEITTYHHFFVFTFAAVTFFLIFFILLLQYNDVYVAYGDN